MKSNNNGWQKLIAQRGKQLVLTLCPLLTLAFVWTGVYVNSIPSASAVTIENLPLVASLEYSEVTEDMQGGVRPSINKTFGAGTTDKIEGQIEETAGSIQQNLGKATEQAEGALRQAQGKAKKDIGEVKGRIDDASSDLDDAGDNAMDALKNLFGQ